MHSSSYRTRSARTSAALRGSVTVGSGRRRPVGHLPLVQGEAFTPGIPQLSARARVLRPSSPQPLPDTDLSAPPHRPVGLGRSPVSWARAGEGCLRVGRRLVESTVVGVRVLRVCCWVAWLRWRPTRFPCQRTSFLLAYEPAGRPPLTTRRSLSTGDGLTAKRPSWRGWPRLRRIESPAASSSWMTTEPPPLDIERILAILTRHGVEFLLVGAVAAIAYGARRLTVDLDCVPVRTYENLDRLAAALRDLNARLRVEGLTDAEAALLPIRIDRETLGRMELSTWRNDAGDFDILADLPMAGGCATTNSTAGQTRNRFMGSRCASPRSTTSSPRRSGLTVRRIAKP